MNTQAVLAETWWAERHQCLNGYTGGGSEAPFLLYLSFLTPQQSFRKKTLCCGMASAYLTFVVFCCIGKKGVL